MFQWRKLVCGAVIMALPSSLVAEDTGAAILHNQGGVSLNQQPAPASSAIFRDDTIQTQPHFEATINATGSTATIKEDSFIQYGDNELFLEHGTVQVSTSRAMRVRVGCLTVIPVTDEWTQYDVTDVDGKVTVNAQKQDVYIDRRDNRQENIRKDTTADKDRERDIVREGEQAKREEKCGVYEDQPSHIAGRKALLNLPSVKWTATGVITVGTLCLILCFNDDPISPSHP